MNLRSVRAVALAAALAAPAASQVTSVRTLLAAGDVLPPGVTVDSVLDVSISDGGSWAARVMIQGQTAAVVDGRVALRMGDTIGGESLEEVEFIRLTNDGRLAAIVETTDASGGSADRFIVDSQVVLSSGDTVPGSSPGTTLDLAELFEFALEDQDFVLVGRTVQPGQNRNVLLEGRLGGGAPTILRTIEFNDAVPGLSGPYRGPTPRGLDVTPNGLWATGILMGISGGDVPAFLVDGSGNGEFGAAAPSPGATWTIRAGGAYHSAINESGTVARSGNIELSTGSVRSAVYRGNVILALEGSSVAGLGLAGRFDDCPVEVTEADEVLHLLNSTTGVQALRLDNETLIRTGLTETVSGEVVSNIFRVYDASNDGRSIAALARVQGDTSVRALLVERDIVGANVCTAVPNTTGVAGRIEAIGSRWVQFNDLAIRASRLPADQFALLLNGETVGFTPNPGGSDGNLCLGGLLGRHNATVQLSDAAGEVLFPVDLGAIPFPSALVAVAPGDTFVFQVWHRDGTVSAPRSNFTEARSIRFQ
ncbi:MAG: hypothetical protein AAFU73_20530 [Planctomycetota bacterium]